MPLSTFLGLETALRGHPRQQQAIDITGHNIANANTTGYTPAVRGADADHAVHVPATRPPKAGQLGTGVDVSALPAHPRHLPRHPVPGPDHAPGLRHAQQDGLGQVELRSTSPPTTASTRCCRSTGRPGRTSRTTPEYLATRQALVQSGPRSRAASTTLSNQLTTIAGADRPEPDAHASTRSTRSAPDRALNDGDQDADGRRATQPNDLLDQRDMLIDQLSAARQHHRDRPRHRRHGRR